MKTLFFAAAAIALTANAQVSAERRMVVVVSLDGFPGYALDDPKLPAPTLRRLIHDGGQARMTAVNPTVTWPNHTSMVTGVRSDEHGLITNGTILLSGSEIRVDPRIDKDKMVRVPTVYDAAHAAGLTTAQVNWVAVNRASTIDWAFNEWATSDGPLEREMISRGVLTAASLENFTKANILFRDQIWTSAGVYLIREHHPNLLLIHFLTLDSIHHQYGPGSLAANAAIAFVDSCVARLMDAVRSSGMMDRTTFLVVSDHGFKNYSKQLRPMVALAAAGLSAQQVAILPEGGTAYLYFDPAIMAKVTGALQNVEGISEMIEPARFASLAVLAPSDPQMYQLLLTAKDGYSFTGALGGPVTAAVPQQAGSHGYLATDHDMDAIFIASGYGVRKGTGANWGQITNIDVASTIAELLGVQLPTAKGKPVPIH